MLKKIVSIFCSILIAFGLSVVECQTTWQSVNNTCTNVNPPTSLNNVAGLSYLYYWNGPQISCGFVNIVENAGGASYTSTFTYTNSTTGYMFSKTFTSLLNPNKQGEVQGYNFPNQVPTQVSDIAAFVNLSGFSIFACPFTNGSISDPIVALFQFNQTENQTVTSSLESQLTSQNIDITGLFPVHQGSDCEYTILTFQ